MLTLQKRVFLADKDVLLVGVDEVDEMLMRYMVAEQDANLIVENTAKGAIAKISDRKYDLLIINTRVENVNSLDLIHKMRANKEIRVPVIGLTSRDMSGRALFSGFDYVIRRPLEKSKFLSALQKVIA